MSANAPAGMAKRKTGSVLAACTSATQSGSGLRLVISQPAAAPYIHEPMLETTVAVHTTVNTRLRNAADNDDGVLAGVAPAGLLINPPQTDSSPERGPERSEPGDIVRDGVALAVRQVAHEARHVEIVGPLVVGEARHRRAQVFGALAGKPRRRCATFE